MILSWGSKKLTSKEPRFTVTSTVSLWILWQQQISASEQHKIKGENSNELRNSFLAKKCCSLCNDSIFSL